MAKAKSVRLSVGWDDSKWLSTLPWPVRAVWPVILCWVRTHGKNGQCAALTLNRFAGRKDIPIECVTALFDAAIKAEALVIENDVWFLPKWEEYQRSDRTGAERQKRFRGKNTENNGVTVAVEPENNGVTENITALRNVTPPTPLDGPPSPQHSLSPPIIPPTPDSASRKNFVRPTVSEIGAYMSEKNCPISEAERFFDYHESKGWKIGTAPMKDWRAAVRTWIGNRTRFSPASNGVTQQNTIQSMAAETMEAIYGNH